MDLFEIDIFLILWTSLTLLCLAFWVTCLIDILKSDFAEINLKLIWILIVIFLPILGSILYFIIGRKQKK